MKTKAKRPLRKKKNNDRMNPMAEDIKTIVIIENFAAFELPLPNSFATLTLKIIN